MKKAIKKRPIVQPLNETEEAILIADLLNLFHQKHKLDAGTLPLMQAYLHSRYEALEQVYEKRGPDLAEGPALIEELHRNAALAEMSFFSRRGRRVMLHDTRNGMIMATSQTAGKSLSEFFDQSAVQVEVLLEVLIGVIGAVFFSGAAHNENLKKAAKETATQLTSNPAIKRLLKELMELLQRDIFYIRQDLLGILKRLFTLMWDALSDLFRTVFAGLGKWDILVMLFDLLVCFTPLGWAKRAVSLMSPFVGLTVSLGVKYQRFSEGTA